jgi:hypothetical protein
MYFDEQICHVTFTHTDCSDVWKLYFPQMERYFPSKMAHYVCVEKNDVRIPKEKHQVIYDERQKYPKRLYNCLSTLEDYEYVFFDHEDMFLYDFPMVEKLQRYYQLCQAGRFDHIRLIKGGKCVSASVRDCPTLYELLPKSQWIFSIQPSFWRRSTLMEILKRNLDVNIWDLELKSQKVVKKTKLKAAFSYLAGQRRGFHHFDNNVYPYIATAIGKGKWNLGEYGVELERLLFDANIDPSERGWF